MFSRVKNMKLNPQAMLERMGTEMYAEAYRTGMNLSLWLEHQHPETEYKDGVDAFSRLLMLSGVRTHSQPRLGLYANTWEEFTRNEHTRALVPEWCARVWRSAQWGVRPDTRAIYLTTDTESTVFAPGDQFGLLGPDRWDTPLAPAIPLSELVAQETGIDGDTYKNWYLISDVDEERMVRVAEGTDIPTAKLVSGERAIRLHKYGRGLLVTYEQLRRQQIDKIALHLARIAVRSEVDKVLAVMDVLINGDGNSGTAAEVIDQSTIDPDATVNELSTLGWLGFEMEFEPPYVLTTALMRSAHALQLRMLPMPLVNPLNSVPLYGTGAPDIVPINRTAGSVRYGWTSDAPANQIVGFDARFAIERITEIGSNIQEVDRFIQNQTQLVTMTESEGYGVIDPDATKILNLAA